MRCTLPEQVCPGRTAATACQARCQTAAAGMAGGQRHALRRRSALAGTTDAELGMRTPRTIWRQHAGGVGVGDGHSHREGRPDGHRGQRGGDCGAAGRLQHGSASAHRGVLRPQGAQPWQGGTPLATEGPQHNNPDDSLPQTCAATRLSTQGSPGGLQGLDHPPGGL